MSANRWQLVHHVERTWEMLGLLPGAGDPRGVDGAEVRHRDVEFAGVMPALRGYFAAGASFAAFSAASAAAAAFAAAALARISSATFFAATAASSALVQASCAVLICAASRPIA